MPMKCSRLFSSILYFVLSAAYNSSRSSSELLAIAKSSTCVRKNIMSPSLGPLLKYSGDCVYPAETMWVCSSR